MKWPQMRKESKLREIERLGPERPLVLFDIDGTLTKGYTIYSFAEYLVGNGVFDPNAWEAMEADFAVYRASQRTNDDYRVFAVNLVDHYAQGLKGHAVSDTVKRARDFFEEARNGKIADYKILDFAPELVRTMNRYGRTVAVSGSPIESLTPLIDYLGIPELKATELDVVDGIFTGNIIVNMALDISKSEIVEELKVKGYDRKHSFAFGDSPHDYPLLKAVDNAFIVGYDAGLIKIGRKYNWPVLSNPEDVIPTVRARVTEIFGGDSP